MAVDREKVIRTALDLLDEVGLDGLTLRRLADRLGIRAPTLYWHVKSKQELLDEMATTMARDHPLPLAPGMSWADGIRAGAGSIRAMLLSRRDGAKVFSGTYVTDDAVLAAQEAPLRLLTDAGFTVEDAVAAWVTVYGFVVGYTIEQQASRPSGVRDPRYGETERAARIDPAEAPLAAAAVPAVFTDPDATFERGLAIIVAGLTTLRPPAA